MRACWRHSASARLVTMVLAATAVVAMAFVAACSTSSRAPAATTPATPAPTATSAATGATSSTTAAPQTSGTRTVLSPIGLNVRAQPSKTAAILGTAAQGTTLTVLGHSDQGFYQVKGATVTGFISDKSTLSASGEFMAYSSSPLQFSALYPKGWNPTEAPPNAVVFHSPTGGDAIVVTMAASLSLLGRGRSGYRQSHDEQIVVCGVTGDLVTFEQVGTPPTTAATAGAALPEHFLAQIHLLLDGQHALGIDANLADTAQLQTLRDFANSVSFAFPQCEQGTGATTPTTAVH